jgi:xanthine/uracil permease
MMSTERRLDSMIKYKSWSWTKRLLPVVIGATAGYAYYYFIGCVSGTCPITSNPWISTAYGALVGFFILPSRKKTE